MPSNRLFSEEEEEPTLNVFYFVSSDDEYLVEPNRKRHRGNDSNVHVNEGPGFSAAPSSSAKHRKHRQRELEPQNDDTLNSHLTRPHKSAGLVGARGPYACTSAGIYVSSDKDEAPQSDHRYDKRKPRPATQDHVRVKHPKVPDWLKAELLDVRKCFPKYKLEVCYAVRGEDQYIWGINCCHCSNGTSSEEAQIFFTRPGCSLRSLRSHLSGRRHAARQGKWPTKMKTAAPRIRSTSKEQQALASPFTALASRTGQGHAAPNVAPTDPKKRDEDDVVCFLRDIGLSGELAGALRRVGISDEARIRGLGGLEDCLLGRLEKSLEEEGLDLSARLLVRDGLRRKATVALSGF